MFLAFCDDAWLFELSLLSAAMEDGRGGKRAQGSSAAAGQQTDPKKLKHARGQPDIGRFYVPTPKAISPVLRPKDMTREEFARVTLAL